MAVSTTTTDEFQSTHPVRGGTAKVGCNVRRVVISIHPPREGWDALRSSRCLYLTTTFQSTHPVRGGTRAADTFPQAVKISIHPPREGWDYTEIISQRR